MWALEGVGGVPTLVNRLADGDSFGEEALLAECSRTATVTMTTPGRLLVLSKSDFNALLRPPMVEEVNAEAARDMIALGVAKLVDCRHPLEHEGSRITGARLVPLDSLRHEGVFALDPDTTYVVYCDTGRRSRAAAFLLHERGIRALSLAGGITHWPYAIEGASV